MVLSSIEYPLCRTSIDKRSSRLSEDRSTLKGQLKKKNGSIQTGVPKNEINGKKTLDVSFNGSLQRE